MKLRHQVILIAGASAGMGRQLALLLSQQENSLILFARRQQELDHLLTDIRTLGGTAIAITGDACNADDARRCVEAAQAQFGRIDMAVLNVGAGPEQSLEQISAADIQACMTLNYQSLANFLPPLLTLMLAQQQGTIAHINSLAGFLGLPQQGPYSAAKAACRMLMDACRAELGGRGLRFVSLYPGFVRTRRVEGYGTPIPFSISEEQGARLLLKGLESRRSDYLFPGPLSWLIRLARLLPKPLLTCLLNRRRRQPG